MPVPAPKRRMRSTAATLRGSVFYAGALERMLIAGLAAALVWIAVLVAIGG